jgi:hypothetical protein
MKYLDKKFDKTNFISPKGTPPKSPGLLGLIKDSYRAVAVLGLIYPNSIIKKNGGKSELLI